MKFFFNFLIFLILSILTYSYEANGIKLENFIYIGTPLKLQAEFESYNYKWNIEKKPFLSNLRLENEEKTIKVIPDLPGDYEISIERDFQKAYIKFTAYKNTEFLEKEIYDRFIGQFQKLNINPSYSLKNMNDYLNEMNKNYPYSFYIKDMLKKISNSALEYDEVVYAEKYINKYLEEYKLSQDEKNEYYVKLFKLYDKKSKSIEAREIIKKIKADNLEYKKLFSDYLISSNIAELEKVYENTLDKEIGKKLGDYYLKNLNPEKAMIFYKNSDKFNYVKMYIDKTKNYDISLFEEDLTQDEKVNLQNYIDFKKQEEKINGYYDRAKENMDSYKFELAEIYYKKILENTNNEDLIKKVWYDMAKLYFLEKNFEKSKTYFNFYKDKYGDFKKPELSYYLASIYYNLGDYEKTEEELNKISENYPFTIWETKAKVYKVKINKIKNKEGEVNE